MNAVRVVLGWVLVISAIGWALDLHRSLLGLTLFTEQFLAAVLGVSLALSFLYAARDRAASWVGWAYLCAAPLPLGAGLYIAVEYQQLSMLAALLPVGALIAGTILLVALLEALRLTAGWALVIVVLAFIGYALLGHMAPGMAQSRYTAPEELVVYLAVDANGLLGVALQVAAVVVIPFVLFGSLLSRCGAADFFTEGASALMGRYRGGAGKVAVTASALFGTVSGSAVGNVVGTGVVTIPLMKRSGFPPHYAGAVEAVASTGGQLVPPVMGAVAFIMAEMLRISYADVMIAALLPAFLYYFAVFVQVDLYAAKNGMVGLPQSQLPSLRATLAKGAHFLLPFAVLVYALVWANAQPELAAIWAIAALLLVSFVFGYGGRRPTWADIRQAVDGTSEGVKEIVIVCAGAGIIIGVLNLSGLAFNLTLHIVAAAGGSALVLAVITALISIVLGMGMPTVGVYILLATLVAPALVQVGIPEIAAHMFVLYFGLMSMVTPPVALAAFAAANIAGANQWRTGWASMQLGWTAYLVPFLFLFAPSLLLIGAPAAVVWSAVTALLGIWAASVAVVGYFRGPLRLTTRAAMLVSGVCAVVPADAFTAAAYIEGAGLLGLAVLFGRQWLLRRASRERFSASG